jgi:Saxitoxin biosynthesis operon protein SxtJ
MKTASSRSFGLLLTAFFAVLAAISYYAHGHAYRWWGAAAVLCLILALTMPRLLAPAKRLWLKLGHVLHLVVSPIVLGLTYVLAIIPVGGLIRLTGKDLLALKLERDAPSYWIRRDGGGPAPQSLKDQF